MHVHGPGQGVPGSGTPGLNRRGIAAIRTVLDCGIVAGAGGGIEKTLIAGAVPRDGDRYRSIVALVHPPADSSFASLRERAAASGVELLDRAEAFALSPLTVAWFASLCRRHRVQIWHGHDYKTNLIGLLLQPRLGFSLVATLHGWSERTWRTRLYFGIDRQVVRRYHQVVAVSSALHDEARRLGIPDERLSLIENGVDTDQYRRVAPELRSLGTLRIGAAGRLTPEKGFLELIAAVEGLLDEGLDVRLAIAGEGPQAAALGRRIRESRHRERLALPGYVNDMREFYATIDVFCLSSLREGLPNVVLEAMSMSLPVVATAAGGLATFLHDGRDALLCPPGSVPDLRDALRRLAQSPELQGRLSAAARARVVADCSFAERMRRMYAVYDRLG